MRITKLQLKNIGVFEDVTISFPEKTNKDKAEIHIFTGENGTGKSTILYALSCIKQSSEDYRGIYMNPENESEYLKYLRTEKSLQDLPIIKRFRYNGDKSNISISFDESSSIDIYRSEISISVQSSLRNYLHSIIFYPNNSVEFAFFAYSGNRNFKNTSLEAIRDIIENPFEKSLDFEKATDFSLFIQWLANTKAKEALELAKNNTIKAEQYKRTIIGIENTISEITGKEIKFILETEPLNVFIQSDGQTLDFDVLPDGLKSIISWIGDLLMRMDRIRWKTDEDVFDRNFILFLDEIELHLHPAWQRRILPVIQKLFKNAQIFISTHSPFVVGSVEDAWVYKLKLEDGQIKNVPSPEESKAGDSISLILNEIFDIEEEFDVETEKGFAEFYQLKKQLLSGESKDFKKIEKKGEDLAKISLEVRDIIGREIRQLKKLIPSD